MSTPSEAIDEFKAVGADKLLELLKSNFILKDEEATGVVYDLTEIADSVAKVYSVLVPEILNSSDASVETVKTRFGISEKSLDILTITSMTAPS